MAGSRKKVVKIETQKLLAEAFRVHLRTIGDWIAKGLPKEPDGQYNLEKCKNWVQRFREPAKLPGLPEAAKKLREEIETQKNDIAWYKLNFADILKKKQIQGLTFLEVVDELIRVRMPTMGDKDLIRLRETLWTSFGIAYDKERLERDLSTSNIAVLYQRAQELKRDKIGQQAA